MKVREREREWLQHMRVTPTPSNELLWRLICLDRNSFMCYPFSDGKSQNTLTTRHGGNRDKAKVTNYQVKDFSREKYRRLKVCVELMSEEGKVL